MNEQNKKATHDGMDRKKKDDTIIKNGVIQIDAESIVFAKGAFKACDDQDDLGQQEVVAMRTVEEFEKATNECQKPMSDYSRIIVETDEKSPKTLAVITDDDCETVEGLRVRFLPVYNQEDKSESK